MILVIIIYMIISLLLNKFFLKKTMCLPSILTIIWCISLSLSLFGFFDVYKPSNSVAVYSMIFLSSFNFFSIFFNLFIKTNKKIKKYDYKISHQFLNFILVLCSFLLIFFCRKSFITLITTHDFNLVRNLFISYNTISEYSQVFIYISIIPLGKACMILSSVEYIKSKKISSSLILSLLFLLLCSIITGGRSYLFLIVLVFILSLYLHTDSIKKIMKKYKKAISVITFLIIIMIFITSKRGFSDGGIFKSVYVYFCASFSLFNQYIEKGLVFGKKLLFGKEMFGGILFPFIEILRYVFNVNILPGNYILDAEATSKYIGISPTIAINASPSVLYFAIRDFGIVGLIIYPMILSFMYIVLKKKSMHGNSLDKANYVYYISLCMLLTMSFPFDSFKNVGVFVYLLMLCLCFKKEEIK